MQPLAILGAGGDALDLLDVIDSINAEAVRYDVVGLFDDGRPAGSRFHGFPLLGSIDDAVSKVRSKCMFAASIWNAATAHRLGDILKRSGVPRDRFETLVHTSAQVSARARVGRGVVINAGVSVAGNVVIEDFVSLGPGCIVGHDTTIARYSRLAAGAVVAGNVTIRRSCYVGSGALVREQQIVEDGAVIGMGAVAVKDVAAGTTVVGVPAAPLAHTVEPTSTDAMA